MKAVWTLTVLVVIVATVDSNYTPPKVQVYSEGPGAFGSENMLICHVSHFHPPDISIQLVRGGLELDGPRQTDLAFNPDWHFHLTRNAVFTPADGQEIACRVNHGGRITFYAYEPNM